MADYNAKRAIADLGFINSYVRQANLPGDDIWFDSFIETLNRIENYVRMGYLLTQDASPEEVSGFLYDVGYMRASIWNDKIPYAVSEALSNLVNFFTQDQGRHFARSEPKQEMLSDHARDVLGNAAENGVCMFRLGLSGEVDATQDAIVRYTCKELGAADRIEAKEWAEEARSEWEAEQDTKQGEPTAKTFKSGPIATAADAESYAASPLHVTLPGLSIKSFNLSGKMGLREWTLEQRAAQAERARNRPPLIPDDALEAVKSEWQAGMYFDLIGRKFGCSGSHIRNFLKRHGIDPRRGNAQCGRRPALTEMEKQILLDEKAKGTPSKVIGKMIDRSQHAVDVKYGELKRRDHK